MNRQQIHTVKGISAFHCCLKVLLAFNRQKIKESPEKNYCNDFFLKIKLQKLQLQCYNIDSSAKMSAVSPLDVMLLGLTQGYQNE